MEDGLLKFVFLFHFWEHNSLKTVDGDDMSAEAHIILSCFKNCFCSHNPLIWNLRSYFDFRFTGKHAWRHVKAVGPRVEWIRRLQTARGLPVGSQHPHGRHSGNRWLLPLAGQAAGGFWLPSGGGESEPRSVCGSVPRGGRGNTQTHSPS